MEAVINNLDDLIFKDRNKNYGAYANRKNYYRYLFWALISATTIFLSGISIPLIANYVNKDKMDSKTAIYVADSLLKIDIEKVKPIEIPKQEVKKPEYTYHRIVATADTNQPIIDLAALQEKGTNKNLNDTVSGKGDTVGVKKPVIIETTEVTPPIRWAEIMPEFPGGEEARLKYLAKNTVYPDAEKRADIEGTVYLNFVVDERGKITNVEILRGVSPGLDAESLRVVQNMPRWSPGLQNGQAVRVAYTMPIKFRLE